MSPIMLLSRSMGPIKESVVHKTFEGGTFYNVSAEQTDSCISHVQYNVDNVYLRHLCWSNILYTLNLVAA